MPDLISRLQKFIWVTNDRVTEERNQVLRDAIQEIQNLNARIVELERDEWKKYD